MDRARRLLAARELSATEIAGRVGYENASIDHRNPDQFQRIQAVSE
jgi:AraC-like DNA-binding protein